MTEDKRIGEVVVEWHRRFLSHDGGTARSVRARLKRCSSPVEAFAVEETHELNALLIKANSQNPTVGQLALLATTFARLRSINGERLASAFGTKSVKDGPRRLSEIRFQSLIRVKSRRELIAPLRRSMAVLGPDLSCNGWKLAEDLFYWNDKVRCNWCFQYFGAEFTTTNQGESDQ